MKDGDNCPLLPVTTSLALNQMQNLRGKAGGRACLVAVGRPAERLADVTGLPGVTLQLLNPTQLIDRRQQLRPADHC